MAEGPWALRPGPLSYRVVQGNAWYLAKPGLWVRGHVAEEGPVLAVGLLQVEPTHFLSLPHSDKFSDNSSCRTSSWALPASSSPALGGAGTANAPGTGQEPFGLSVQVGITQVHS